MTRSVSMSVVSTFLLAACCGKSDSIGVAECDAYVQRLNQCADKVGGPSGDALRRFSKRMVTDWKDSAGKPEQKEMLAKTCSEAIADAKKANPMCDW